VVAGIAKGFARIGVGHRGRCGSGLRHLVYGSWCPLAAIRKFKDHCELAGILDCLPALHDCRALIGKLLGDFKWVCPGWMDRCSARGGAGAWLAVVSPSHLP
jgi:hypothetical protein